MTYVKSEKKFCSFCEFSMKCESFPNEFFEQWLSRLSNFNADETRPAKVFPTIVRNPVGCKCLTFVGYSICLVIVRHA